MSYRELWVFVQHLPPESWTQTLLRDGHLEELVNPATTAEEQPRKFGPWAHRDYLLVDLIDAVRWNTYVTEVAGGIKDPRPPEPMPRPGLAGKRPERRNPEAVVLYLDKLRARG